MVFDPTATTESFGFQDNYQTTLADAMTDSQTTCELSELPTPDESTLVIDPGTDSEEEIYYTSKGEGLVNIPSVSAGRGVNGTAKAHNAGAVVKMMPTKAQMDTLKSLGTLTNGVLGYAQRTLPHPKISSEVDIFGLTVTVTVPVGGRKIKITGQTSFLPSQANTIGYMYIKEGATYLGQVSTILAATTVTQGVSCQVILTPTAGSHTYKLAARCESTPHTLTSDSAAARPSFILVEYLGGV